jgi:hypothetical protein
VKVEVAEADPTPTQGLDGHQGEVPTGPAPPPRHHPDPNPRPINEGLHGLRGRFEGVRPLKGLQGGDTASA